MILGILRSLKSFSNLHKLATNNIFLKESSVLLNLWHNFYTLEDDVYVGNINQNYFMSTSLSSILYEEKRHKTNNKMNDTYIYLNLIEYSTPPLGSPSTKHIVVFFW